MLRKEEQAEATALAVRLQEKDKKHGRSGGIIDAANEAVISNEA